MDKPLKYKDFLRSFTLRTLAISLSSLALFDLLKGEYHADMLSGL